MNPTWPCYVDCTCLSTASDVLCVIDYCIESPCEAKRSFMQTKLTSASIKRSYNTCYTEIQTDCVPSEIKLMFSGKLTLSGRKTIDKLLNGYCHGIFARKVGAGKGPINVYSVHISQLLTQ